MTTAKVRLCGSKWSTLILLILFLSLCGVANAATLRVGDGQTYTTIQSALDVAMAGDVISIVTPKTYNEQLTLKSSGTSGNPITLQNDSDGVVWVESANAVVLNCANKHYWTIKNIRFRYIGSSNYSTIDASGGNPSSSYITIDGCHIIHTGGAGSLIYIRWADHITIKNCLIQQAGGSPSDGIRIFNSHYIDLKNNEITPSDPSYGKDGICISGTNYNIQGNFIHDAENASHPDGIVIQGQTTPETTDNIEVHGNIVRNWGQLIYWDAIGSAFSGTHLAYNNLLYRTDGWAAKCAGIVLNGYNINGTGSYQIPVDVYNNTIWVAGPVIYVLNNGGGQKRIKNNLFYNCTGWNGSTYIWINEPTGVELDYNEYSGGFSQPISWANKGYTLSQFQQAGLGEIHGTSVSANLDDSFKPIAGSGNIDIGFNLSPIFDTDMLGISRPQGLAWDIGAYEYAPPGPLPPAPTGLTVIPE